jgi:hypothetical protein
VASTGSATALKLGAVTALKVGAVGEGALGADAVDAEGAAGSEGKVGAEPGDAGKAGSLIVGAVIALGVAIVGAFRFAAKVPRLLINDSAPATVWDANC